MSVLLISEVEKILDSYLSQIKREPIIVFLNAMNDWPDDLLSLEDYELAVSSFIDGIASKNNISIALAGIDVSKNAWECESLTL